MKFASLNHYHRNMLFTRYINVLYTVECGTTFNSVEDWAYPLFPMLSRFPTILSRTSVVLIAL